MELAAFDPDSSVNRLQERGRESTNGQVRDPGEMAQAVAELLRNKCLSHSFGVQGEWEVRTTLVANGQAWRYQSRVFVHGKEARKRFSPIAVDRTRPIRQNEAVTEEVIAAFVGEAAEVHLARCSSVAEYIVMASIFSQPLPRHHRMKAAALVLLSVAALLTASWWWSNSVRLEPHERRPPSHSVRWQTLQVSYHYPAGEPFVFPLPALERVPKEIPVEVTLEASGDEPGWLQLDRERLHIRGTAPPTIEDQTYRLIIRAHAERGSDSRLLVLFTIKGQPDRISPTPRLPRHWTW